MATRYWTVITNMGFPGTTTTEEYDLLDYFDTEEEIIKCSDLDAHDIVYHLAQEDALEMIEINIEESD